MRTTALKLTVDIGNTRKKFVLWDNQTPVKSGFFSDEFPAFEEPVSQIGWCSTAGELPFVNHVNPEQILHLNAFPDVIKTCYSTPETLGQDRIAAVTGAVKLYKGKPVLIIDAGTCITTDLITEENVHMGGTISPGLNMRLRAMHEFTAKLPLLEAEPTTDILGKSTKTSMLAGVWQGIAGELNYKIHSLLKEYPDLVVLITGGDSDVLADYVNYRIFAEPFLVHYGLLYFLELNAI